MLLSSSSSRSSHSAAPNQCTGLVPGVAVPKHIEREVPSLRNLINQHTAAIQDGRRAKARRLAIINYKPKEDGEEQLKLTYLAGYLIATKSTLTGKELKALAKHSGSQAPG